MKLSVSLSRVSESVDMKMKQLKLVEFSEMLQESDQLMEPWGNDPLTSRSPAFSAIDFARLVC